MGRNVTLDFRTGGGAPVSVFHGTALLEPTSLFVRGNAVVLPDHPYSTGLSRGQGTFVDVEPSPAGPMPEWCYKLTVRDRTGRGRSFLVGVPAGTSAIAFKDLPVYDEVSPADKPALVDLVSTAVAAKNDAQTSKTSAEAASAQAQAAANLVGAPAAAVVETVLNDRMASVAHLTENPTYVYVNRDTGSDISGNGSPENPYQSMKYAASKCPKLINQTRVYKGWGVHDEDVAFNGVCGAGIWIQPMGGVPSTATEALPFKIRSISFQDCVSRVLLNGFEFFNAAGITPDSNGITRYIRGARLEYLSILTVRIAEDNRALTKHKAIEFDKATGTVSGCHFDGQNNLMTVANGSSVKVYNTNTHGPNNSTTGLWVEGAVAYKVGNLNWMVNSTTTPYKRDQAGQILDEAHQPFTPEIKGRDGMTVSNVNITQARSTVIGRTCFFSIRASFDLSGTAAQYINISLPEQAYMNIQMPIGSCEVNDGGFDIGRVLLDNRTQMIAAPAGKGARWTLGADRRVYIQGWYEVLN